MALTLLGSQTPCFNYHPFDPVIPRGSWNSYGYDPSHPPKFDERLNRITGFYYWPGSGGGSLSAGDYFIAPVWFDQCDWPGWGTGLLAWDAATGKYAGRLPLSFWNMVFYGGATATENGQIFAVNTYGGQWTLQQVQGDTLDAAAWSFDLKTLPPINSQLLSIGFYNRRRNLLVGCGASCGLSIWDLSSPIALQGRLQPPNSVAYLSYEDQENVWLVTVDGLVAKANYRDALRWELLSAVEAPAPETRGYFCAWDPARKRLVILRWLPDATDGTCRLQLEFYRPLYVATLLTDPVPVTSLQAGGKIDFVAHLIGDAGEGVSPYNVAAALGGTPAGVLQTPQAATELNGAVAFHYQAPNEACSEVLNLSIDV
jgi:hypothetical protein